MSVIATFIKKLFGPGRPAATSDALMVGAARGVNADEKSTLSLALERAKAERQTRYEPAAHEASSAEEVGAPAPKKAAKKRAPRKRKAAAVADDEGATVEAPADEALADEPPASPVAVPSRSPGHGADVWMSDAVAWSLSGRWSCEEEMWTPPPGAEAPKRLEEFREKAAEGKLVIWGRAGEVGRWEPIEATYWKSCGVEQFSFLEGREKVFTEPKTAGKPKPGKSGGAEKYTALKVNRAQVEEVWQPGTMH